MTYIPNSCENCRHLHATDEFCEDCRPIEGEDLFEPAVVDADVQALTDAMQKPLYLEVGGPSCSLMDTCKWSHSMGIEEECYSCVDGDNYELYEEEDMDEMDKVIDLHEPKPINLTESEVIAKHTCQGCGVNKGDRHEIDCPWIVQDKLFPENNQPEEVVYKPVADKVTPAFVPVDEPEADPRSAVPQIGGNHYRNDKVETWDLYEQAMSDDEFRGAMKNNIIKYLLRYRYKNGVQDLQKAKSYISRLIEFEKGRRMVSMPVNIHTAADDNYTASELIATLADRINDLLERVKP